MIIKNSSEPNIDTNFFYATGLSKGLFEESIAFLYPDGALNLIIPKLEEESANKADAEINVYRKKEEFYDLINENIGLSKKIGLNYNGILHNDFLKFKKNIPKVKFFDISESLSKSRAIKDKEEILKIKEACKISDKVMEKIPEVLTNGLFEYELAAQINYIMQKNGADKTAFETISSFGKNSSQPHYSHGKIKLKKGDFVLCDFGANLNKYNSDMTRTVVFGKSSNKQKDMYNTVLKAQELGIKNVKAGIKACQVHETVYNFIQKTKFKDCFIHSTGHSLGLDVHDGYINFGPNCQLNLEENMVLTVEPGVYLPGFGGVRIEDDVLVKNDGVEVLTKSSKKFIEVL